jgi:hypothetical protein
MHGRRRGFDVMLRGRVDSLLGAVHGADPYGSLFLDVSELAPQAEDIYVAATASGIVGSSQQVPPNVLASIRASNASGFFNFEWKGQVYRAFHKEGVRSMDQGSGRSQLRSFTLRRLRILNTKRRRHTVTMPPQPDFC